MAGGLLDEERDGGPVAAARVGVVSDSTGAEVVPKTPGGESLGFRGGEGENGPLAGVSATQNRPWQCGHVT